MGLFSSIASYMGAKKKKKAAGKAAEAQIAAAQQGVDKIGDVTGQAQQIITDQNATGQASIAKAMEAFLPFISGGQQAFGAQGDLLGLGGNDAQASAIAGLKDSPLFQSLFRTGEEAVLANGSATGGLRGGNIQSSLANFGGDTLAKVIQNQLSNLGGMTATGLSAAGDSGNLALGGAQIGGNAASQIAQLLENSGVNIAELFGNQGAAKAGGILGKANASADMWSAGMSGLGDIAAAFLPMPGGAGMGSKIAGLI